METFKALEVSETPEGEFERSSVERVIDDLPEGEVLVRVEYSSLNYKDALSASGNKGVTREYPHTPGIDAAGRVRESSCGDVNPGDTVIVHGYDLGMNTAGGFGEYIRVPAAWVVPMPEGLSCREAMLIGTAGFTAALCLDAFEAGNVTPESGSIVVSGASGGVGCSAVALLASQGYTIVAVTGKPEVKENLQVTGASEVLDREDVMDDTGRPLLKGRWAGVVDTVGGELLDCLVRATRPQGVVAACGNAASGSLNTSLYPFIIRGVRLQGIDSAATEISRRRALWRRLAGEWSVQLPDALVDEVGLEGLGESIDRMLAGTHVGRTLVKHDSHE